MKEKLIELLGLAKDATDEQIEQAVSRLGKLKTIAAKLLKLKAGATEEDILDGIDRLQTAKAPQLAAPTAAEKREAAIRKKIEQSGGALNREQAAMAIDHQAEANAKKKGKGE